MSVKSEKSESGDPKESSLIPEISLTDYTVRDDIVTQGLWGNPVGPKDGQLADLERFKDDRKRLHGTE